MYIIRDEMDKRLEGVEEEVESGDWSLTSTESG